MATRREGAQELLLAKRREIWRTVRDCGAKGMMLETLCNSITGNKRRLQCIASDLVAKGFLHKPGYGEPLQVTWDCRVPAGEEARLGPGWPTLPEWNRQVHA